jgi:hypothetical protein
MITIYKNRIIYTSHRNKKIKVPADVLFNYLGDTVVLDKSVTFETIMEILHVNDALTNIVFGSTLGNYDFDVFYKDYLKLMPESGKNDYKSEFLEIYYYPDLFKYEKNQRFELNHTWDLHLIKTKEDISYSISLVSLCELKKHPIKIKYDVDIIPHDSTKKITTKLLTTPLLKTTLGAVKLFDVLWSILYEISWHGAPDSRDAFRKDLTDRVYDIKNDVKTGDNSDMMTLEQFTKSLKKKKKKK